MKKWGFVIIATLVVVLAVLAWVNHRANDRMKDYQKQVIQMLKERAEQDASIKAADLVIAQKDKDIALYNEAAAIKDAKITALQKDIQELKDSEPSYPELETHPLVINLRAQVSRLQSALSLALSEVKDKDSTIAAQVIQLSKWSDKYDAANTKFEGAEQARIKCELSLKEYAKVPATGFWGSLARSLFSTDTLLKLGVGFTLGLLAD